MPDVFICHDSRDKESFVRPLVEALQKRFLNVWYDEFSLSVGDSLVDKINEGLSKCRFGVVVVSKNLLENKAWTAREYRILTAREIDSGTKIVLPIWLGVTKADVAAYSIDLSDKVALKAESGIDAVAGALKAEVVRHR